MGADLNTTPSSDASDPVVIEGEQQTRMRAALSNRLPWVDEGTAALLSALVIDLARGHPDVAAIILFGSLARHQERPLHSLRPSDVDLLVLAEPMAHGVSIQQTRLSLEQMLAIHHTIGEREYRSQVPALDVQTTLAEWDMAGWDALFVTNVARYGVLLWARSSLPPALAPVASRGAVFGPALC